MQEGFPIVINLDPQLATAHKTMTAVVSKTQMWINFSALKSSWYADENCVLAFEFMLVTTAQFIEKMSDQNRQNWIMANDQQYAFYHDRSHTRVLAFIAIADSEKDHFEQVLKARLVEVANLVVKDYGFIAITVN